MHPRGASNSIGRGIPHALQSACPHSRASIPVPGPVMISQRHGNRASVEVLDGLTYKSSLDDVDNAAPVASAMASSLLARPGQPEGLSGIGESAGFRTKDSLPS